MARSKHNPRSIHAVIPILLLVLILLLYICTHLPSEDKSPLETTSAPETTGQPTQSTEQTQLPMETAVETTATTESVPESQPPVAPQISPNVVSIYIPAADGTPARKQITAFQCVRVPKQDIDCFEILASEEELLSGTSFRAIWNNAWNGHDGAENAKIGFHISFTTTGGETVSKTLLKPSDSQAFFAYLEIYMYDDIHQTPGAWYTHLEDRDMTAETIISSIKLTAGSRIAEVGDIALTAFIYNEDSCFDADGNYIGTVKKTIVITQ